MSLSSRAVAVAASTGCPRLVDAARHGQSDTAVAKARGLNSLTPRLAFQEGLMFEQRAIGGPLDHDKDAPLLAMLDLPEGRVVRLPDTKTPEAVAAVTMDFDRALADPGVAVITQGLLPGLYGSTHRPDLLIRTRDGWQVGEVKVYLDRGGDTPARLVASTATQCAVSVVAARRYGLRVIDTAVIILVSPRGEPSVRPIPIGGEVGLVEALLARAPRPRAEVEDFPLAGHVFSPACVGACALADFCRQEAASAPGVLWAGDTVAPAYGWTHQELLEGLRQGSAPAAVQAGWDAAVAVA